MNILIVCTGNTCRSPIAERVLKQQIKLSGKCEDEYNILSAGLSAIDGDCASKNAVEILKQNEIDLSDHVSHKINTEVLKDADLILTMTKLHKDLLLDAVPKITEKVYTFKEFSGEGEGDVSDPFGGDIEVYRKVYEQIRDLSEKIVRKI